MFLGNGRKYPERTNEPYIFFYESGIQADDDELGFYESLVNEISAADFLELQPVVEVPEFSPFDKVLVRSGNALQWQCAFFSHEDRGVFYASGSAWSECVPYAGNESLVGKLDRPV